MLSLSFGTSFNSIESKSFTSTRYNMVDSSDFIPLGKSQNWYIDTATCHLSRCVVDKKVLLKKSLHARFLNDERLRSCLRKEYEMGCLLSKKTTYVPTYHQFVDEEKECSVIMDFVDGQTLDSFVEANSTYFLNSDYLHSFVAQLLDALLVVHQAQMVHLDLKPTNLLMTSVNHDLRIIDFGLSFCSSFPETEGMTASFAAPEQKCGCGKVDGRSDIYAIGKILAYIEEREQSIKQSYRLPEDLRKLKDKSLESDKDRRWQTISEMQDFLLAFRKKKLLRKRRIVVMAGALTLCLLAVMGWLSKDGQEKSFSDEDGNVYQVISKLKSTCRLMGRADTCRSANLYVEPNVMYHGKAYAVTEIADSAFLGDKKLETICLPSTLREIGDCAFRECEHLLLADIPDSVSRIGKMAFWGCLKLSDVHLPKGIKRLPSSCFSKTALTRVEIPEGTLSIGYDAFGVCKNLREVKLPQTLRSIERGVFWRCSSLKSIYIPSEVNQIGQFCLMECDSLHDVYNASMTPQRTVRLFGKNIKKVTLHVPEKAIDVYRQATGWKEAKKIVSF